MYDQILKLGHVFKDFNLRPNKLRSGLSMTSIGTANTKGINSMFRWKNVRNESEVKYIDSVRI